MDRWYEYPEAMEREMDVACFLHWCHERLRFGIVVLGMQRKAGSWIGRVSLKTALCDSYHSEHFGRRLGYGPIRRGQDVERVIDGGEIGLKWRDQEVVLLCGSWAWVAGIETAIRDSETYITFLIPYNILHILHDYQGVQRSFLHPSPKSYFRKEAP